jgi:TPR repeat protein
LEIVLKTVLTLTCFVLFIALQAPVVMAATWQEDQAKADQFYDTEEYKKAFKMYFKLAKMGVSHSQDRVSTMYASGDGTKLNLTEAYGWSVLAAQRGASEMANKRDGLLDQVDDKKKADSKAKLKANTKGGGCTGSKLGCR